MAPLQGTAGEVSLWRGGFKDCARRVDIAREGRSSERGKVKGGARTNSGPAPDPNALARERDGGEWTVLPAQGRAGDPPQWALTEASARELEWWVRVWSAPQAEQWERLHQDVEVALYVRRL